MIGKTTYQIIHPKTHVVDAIINPDDNSIVFNNNKLAEIAQNGINVPMNLAGDFKNKYHIARNDPDFSWAYIKVYYEVVLKRQGYELKTIKENDDNTFAEDLKKIRI